VRGARGSRPAPSLRLTVEALEDRTLMSVLPVPTISTPVNISNIRGNDSAPVIAVDPIDPQKLVAVYTRNDPDLAPARQTILVEGRFSNDGGRTWLPFIVPGNLIDPTTDPNNIGVYTRATDPSVSFDRSGNVYLVYAQHSDDNSTGAVVLQKYNFSGQTIGAPQLTPQGQGLTFNVLYHWVGDQAVTPTMVVDTNLPTFTDPQTGVQQVDPFSGTIYVAWSTVNRPFMNAPNTFNPRTIKLIASSDGGMTFTAQAYVNDGVNSGADRNTTPRLVISQGTADRLPNGQPRVAGGQVTVVWDDFGSGANANPPVDVLRSDRAPGGRSAGGFSNANAPVPDASDPGGGGAHVPTATPFLLPINADPNFNRVTDLDVTVNLTHPALAEVSLRLLPTESLRLLQPTGLVFGPDGNLYVASQAGNSVVRFNGITGAFLGVFVASRSGGLNSPQSMVFGPDGNLYVTSLNTNQVLRYNGTTGNFLNAFVAAGSGGLTRPTGLVFGPGATGDLYVSSRDTDEVLRYNRTTGAFVGAFVAAASGGLDEPDGLVFGPDNNLYVNSAATDSVLRYDGTTGAFLDTFVAAGSGGLTNPQGLAFSGPHLFVGSRGTNQVLRYDAATGAFINAITGGGLNQPANLVIGPSPTGDLYVSSFNTAQVLRYNRTTGAFTSIFARGFASVTLTQNQTDAAGATNMNIGITGANLGITANGTAVGTVFDDQGPRGIRDGAFQAPYIGHFRPEIPGAFSTFLGLSGRDITSGSWALEIVDFRSGNAGLLRNWKLNFTSDLVAGPDRILTSTTIRGDTNRLVTAATPDASFAIGPTPVLAADNTLGSFSPYQGRLYIAYVNRTNLTVSGVANEADNTDIFLLTSDDGGITWFPRGRVNDDLGVRDGFSGANTNPVFPLSGRPQFQPEIAVDQSTGTLLVSFFDARHDSARARVARYLTTSIDGGLSFGPQTFLNDPNQVFDAITQTVRVLGPIPDNQSQGNPVRDQTFGFGERQGLAVGNNGRVYAAWSSNLNGGGFVNPQTAILRLDIRVAEAAIAAGPRVVSSTMGPLQSQDVTVLADGSPRTINNTRAADGRPVFNGFVVDFDRFVDPATFTAADVTVRYRDVNTTGNAPGTLVTVTAVTPLFDDVFAGQDPRFNRQEQLRLGARKFLVSVAPQSGVGTYSYTVGPNVSDRIRSTAITVIPSGSPVTFATGTINLPLPDLVTTASPLTVSGLPAGQVIADVNVTLNIAHTFNSDLIVILVSPDNTRITLINQRGGSQDNFTNTTLDDQATQSIAAGVAPFTGSFRPETPLGRLLGRNPNGVWRLEITDIFGLDSGTLQNWSLTIQAGTLAVGRTGNLIDQDADALAGEGIDDIHAAPKPVNPATSFSNGFFRPAYEQDTMPIIITGPQVASSRVPLNPVSADNAVLSSIRATNNVPMTVAPGQTITSTINVSDNYLLEGLTVQLDILHPNAPDIEATLIAPDGTRIRLVRNAGASSINKQNFANTTFDDVVAVPVQLAQAPFTGRFQPLDPLSVLRGRVVTGAYRLEIKNNSTTSAGSLQNWSLTFQKSATVNSIDVVFSRDMDRNSFTPADVLRIVGPAGPVSGPFTITPNPNNNDPDANFPRTYRVGFPAQQLGGTYTIVLGPDIRSRSGDQLDSNANGGLEVLRGTSLSGQSVTVTVAATDVPMTIVDQRAITSTINVTDNFVIQGLTLRLNITHTRVPDLEATLIHPDGTRVRLFARVGDTGTRQNLTDTIFDDRAQTPIRNGGPPFFGRFNPQEPLSALVGKASGGIWTLEIRDVATGNGGALNSWSLTFDKPVLSTGLGELVADQTTVSFRIFTMSPANPLSSSTWTAVGPAAIGTNGNSGRIGGLALDPSDPSGNTVYVAGASGGVWKTTNFLTTSPLGPTYTPLTDFGPTLGINIGGIAVFGRNNDTNQSIVFVATGEGDTSIAGGGPPVPSPTSRGVGFLRSLDGGATWAVLDSSDNTVPFDQRDHVFSRNFTTSFKIVVDPRLTPDGEVIVYAAVSGDAATAGIWRSLDTGKHWTRMRAGQATDVVLDPNSGFPDAQGRPTGNLQIIYAGFRGEGVFLSPNRGQVWNQMLGGIGKPLMSDGDQRFPLPGDPIPVTAPSDTPSGAKGRIVLAKPELTGDPLQDLLYQGWLYAVVMETTGRFNGLYITKDFGRNWTRARIPTLGTVGGGVGSIVRVVPTNDISQPDYDVGGAGNFTQGNYNITLTVNAIDPTIVYIGGTNNGQPSAFIRVDTTFVSDPHAFYMGMEKAGGNGALSAAADDPVTLENWTPNTVGQFYNPVFNPFINFQHDPFNPFDLNSSVRVSNIAQFTNTGSGVRWMDFSAFLANSTDLHRALTFRDPLTGQSRLIVGDDQGVFTGVDIEGMLATGIGSVPSVAGSRNGNLQITQLYYGASQPSELAAQISRVRGLFYGMAQDDGFPQSDPTLLQNGNITWTGPGGDGHGVATDQTGTGTVYQYKWPCCGGGGTDFFQVDLVGRTTGLLQQSNPGLTPDPQWPFLGGFNFAVNPLNGDQIIISSGAGRLFMTATQGRFWLVNGEPAALDGTPAFALAFGAPDPAAPAGSLNNFMYAGTEGGRIFVTFTGGGDTGNQWRNISAGLDGTAVRAIVTNPTRGSREAYAVTLGGVFYMADSSAAGATWVNISGNLFQVMHNPFNEPGVTEAQLRNLEAIQADWRYVIPDNPAEIGTPANPPGPTHPVLYVGGEGGVYRSTDKGLTWTQFPSLAEGATRAGGLLPNARVTDLDLALGNVNPTTGRPDVTTGPNLLLATTYGRGSFAIRLSPIVVPGSLRLDPTRPPGGSDTGTSPTDKRTSVLRPFIVGFSLQSAFGNTVSLQLIDLNDPNQRVIGRGTTDETGRFSIQIDAGIFQADGSTDGLKRIGVRAVDGSGTVGDVEVFEYTLDTTPIFNAASLALSPTLPAPGGSDSGSSATDRITNVLRPVIIGSIDQSGPITVQLVDITNPVVPRVIGSGPTNPDGTFAIQVDAGVYLPNGATDGLKTIRVQATRNSANQPTLTFRLDTLPPPPPSVPDLAASSDTGPSSTDNATADNTPTFVGTGEPGSEVQILANGVVVGQATVDSAGNYAVTTGRLARGSYAITARQLDVAGNPSGPTGALVPSLAIEPPPAPSVPDLVASSDTGASNTDNITRAQTPAFVGTALTGNRVQLFANGVLVGEAIADAQGNYSVAVTNPLAQGTYSIRVQQVTPENDVSALSGVMAPALVIDVTPPTRPTLRLNPGFDTGLPGDNLTSAIPQQFDGTTDPQTTVALRDGATVVDIFTQGAGTDFSRTLNLPVGTHVLSAEATDVAGNVIASTPVTVRIDLDVLDPDRRFVRALYQQILGRTGSLPEWNMWVPFLSSPDGRAQIANGIERSAEARTRVVKGWYELYLGRVAQGGEEQFWVQRLVGGQTEEQVLATIFSSTEFYLRAPQVAGVGGGPATDTTLIRAFYSLLLGRQPAASELSFWLSTMAQVGRAQVAFLIQTSIEYRSLVVRGYYTSVLGRRVPPTPPEVAAWVNSGLDLTAIRVQFLGSAEYFFRVTGFTP
jgi:subtilisin-like proprotein convertase family protein